MIILLSQSLYKLIIGFLAFSIFPNCWIFNRILEFFCQLLLLIFTFCIFSLTVFQSCSGNSRGICKTEWFRQVFYQKAEFLEPWVSKCSTPKICCFFYRTIYLYTDQLYIMVGPALKSEDYRMYLKNKSFSKIQFKLSYHVL